MSIFAEFPAQHAALVEFRDYVHSFYGKDGIYDLGCGIPEIEDAIVEYMNRLLVGENDMEWGFGDSLDRERVRFILEEYGFEEMEGMRIEEN